MNETDFIREQLAAERAHLRDILTVVRAGALTAGQSRPAGAYIEWARGRLVAQLAAHRRALEAALPGGTPTRAELTQLGRASDGLADSAGAQPLPAVAERLLGLLDAWSDPLDALAGRTLGISHWRRAAHLSADSILEERQLYAAARAAIARP